MFQTTYDENSKLWSGSTNISFYTPNISIASIILRCLKLYGLKTAQISDDSGVCLTFKELHLMTVRAAQNLQKRGYKPKQVVGIVAENTEHLSSIVFASFCIACPINCMNTTNKKCDLIRMFERTKPSVFFCDVKEYDLVKESLNELKNNAKIFTFNGRKGDSEAVECLFEETGIEHSFIPVEVDGINDTAIILSTSGTSGHFKGACISHANISFQIAVFDLCTCDDIILCVSSLQWLTGLHALLLATFYGSIRVITTKPLPAETQLRLIEKYKVTFLFNSTTDLLSMLKSGLLSTVNMTSVTQFIVAGNKISSSIIEEFQSFLPNGRVLNRYGTTELGGAISTNFNDVRSAGQLTIGNVIKIIDENGNRCGVNTNGEICTKCPFAFLGYYGNRELSQEVVDDEGFFRPGDMGHFDENGNLHITDRKKDLILNYERTSPSEIEDVIIILPGVEAVCVVGVNDSEFDELPAAVVVRKSQITEADICKQVADNMADDCRLRGGVYFVDSIPKTPTGKFLRRWAKDTANKLYDAKNYNSKTIK